MILQDRAGFLFGTVEVPAKIRIPMQIKRLTGPADAFDLRFPDGKSFDVVGFGLNAVDHLCVVPKYPRFDTKTEILHYELLAGGQVATAMTCVARMGLRARYIGKVGSDDLGRLALESMRSEEMDISAVIMQPDARNQFALIIIDSNSGERTILWDRDRRLDFQEGELRQEDICSGRILHLDGHDPAAVCAARWAQEAGIPVVADLDRVVPRCAELLANVDFLVTNADFPAEFTGISNPDESLLSLGRFCRGFLAATKGAQGAVAVVDGKCVHFPAWTVRAVDTTGAGDVFHGGFIYGLLQNWNLDRIMSFANAAAGLSCTRLGARAGIPTLEQVLKLVNGS